MTAKGKINASSVQINDRIVILHLIGDRITESRTKTGEGVEVVRVIGKTFRAAQGPYERRGKYVIETTGGTFEATPIQTMWLAPEDVAGVRRARKEAEAEDALRTEKAEAIAAEERENETGAEILKDEAKVNQIQAWLAKYGLFIDAAKSAKDWRAEADRVAKRYHAAMACDRAEAELMNTRRYFLSLP